MGGRRIDGVSSYRASQPDHQLVEGAAELIERHPKPAMLKAGDQNGRLFFANFDGSGQDLHRRGEIPTNVGALHADLMLRMDQGETRIATEYLPGPGTQKIARGTDLAFGFTVDERAMEMYVRFAQQSQVWLKANPDADISLAVTGYSRGAISPVMFTRLVDRYGILDPGSLRFSRDANGDLKVESDRPPLVPPGRNAQALYLLDPVSTGVDRDFDLRPPPSVITGVSFWARDERRAAFPHRAIIDLGMTDDGRFLGILVPGAHSNIGGGNRLDGLEIRTGNLLRQAINGLSGTPLVPERPVPDDPARDVIHRSHQGLFGVFQIGSSPAGGARARREDLCVVIDPCRDAEPRDEALAARYFAPVAMRRDAGAAAQGDTAALRIDTAAHPAHALFRVARDGIDAIDRQHGLEANEGATRAAAALAAAAREQGLDRIGHVLLGHDRQRLFAVDTDDLHAAHRRIAHVDVVQARAQPIEESTRRVDAAMATAVAAPETQHGHTVEHVQPERARVLVH
ncbi:MAG TPA: XVIPCD domain-containing protein [Lysobacter sp.]